MLSVDYVSPHLLYRTMCFTCQGGPASLLPLRLRLAVRAEEQQRKLDDFRGL